ncbi:MAG: PocR ligand-binding domain-containing protein [bacterium]
MDTKSKDFSINNYSHFITNQLSDKKFINAMEAANFGIWELDFETQKFKFDPILYKMLGYDADEFPLDVTMWREMIHPDDRCIIDEMMEQIKKDGDSYKIEYRFKRKDNTYMWITTFGAVTEREKNGNIKKLNGTYLDNTKKKESEAALKNSERLFRSLFENMQEGVALHEVIFDQNGNPIDYEILDINPMYTIHTGVSLELAKNKLGSEIYKTYPAPHLDIFSEVAITGKPIQFETFIQGLNRHFHVSCFSPSKNMFATVFQDITEKKILADALEKRIVTLTQPLGEFSEIKFEDVFNINEIQSIQDAFSAATGVASIITDTNGIPITKPSNFVRLCNDIIRKTDKGLKNCIHSDACLGRLNPNGPIYQPCLSGGLWDGGTSITAGEKHIANWLIGQVLDENHSKDNMSRYAIEIGADVNDFNKALDEVPILSTEKFKKICDALYVIAGQLSKLAIQNIHQARFITEQKSSQEIIQKQVGELEAKNAELERFTYTVSHDLKSPLITIKGFLGMINSDVANGRYDRIPADMKRISNAADKMQNLLEDLLELSRIGRIVHPPSKFSLTEAAKEAAELLFGVLHSKNINLKIQDDLPIVLADKPRVREVLQNLIENAIKFMGEQTNPEINIGCLHLAGNITFYVKDNGLGIEKQYHKKIFGLFDKLSPSSEGTGIGLAIVKRIIELHGGKIWAESEGRLKGSTFYFTLEESITQNIGGTQ